MAPGTPFGPGIRSLLMYLHHSHQVSFERLSRMLGELFELTISDGAIANTFSRMGSDMAKACQAIKQKLVTARIIASDETTTRVDGVTQWQWAEPVKVPTMRSIGGKQAEGFIPDKAVLHAIAPRQAKSVAEEVLAGHKPAVWMSDRYAGQQELAKRHQVCLALALRDVQYAIDCGDTIFAPEIREHLRWAIRVGKRRVQLKDSTLAVYAVKANTKLDRLVMALVAHPAGKILLSQIKAWRTKFFVSMTDRDVPPTNNISEGEIRPSVVFRKITNDFRSDWGPNSCWIPICDRYCTDHRSVWRDNLDWKERQSGLESAAAAGR